MTQLAQSRAEHEKQFATAGEEDLQPVQEGPLVFSSENIFNIQAIESKSNYYLWGRDWSQPAAT